MFYHARITLAAGPKQMQTEHYALDLQREHVLDSLVLPFLRGEQFFCGGTVIQPNQVRQLRFNVTTQPSFQLIPLLRAQHLAKGYFPAMNSDWYVTDTGRDVTRELLDEAQHDFRPAQARVQAVKAHTNKIFLVHGHDLSTLDQTENMLFHWGLEPIVLHHQANRGMTVIEKVEAYTDVEYGIILLTPDDIGGLNASEPELNLRARQNVVFEWGYLTAKLGRGHVACLRKSSIELPSDLHGVVLINFSDRVKECEPELRRELAIAGYNLKEK